MTKTTFSGKINDQEFNDLDEFNKYFEEHRDEVRSISSSFQYEEVPEEQSVEQESLYPDMLSPDQFMDKYKEDLEQGLYDTEKELSKHFQEHDKMIENLSDELLKEHYDNLMKLDEQVSEDLEKSEKAFEKLSDKKKEIVEKLEIIETSNELLNLYHDHFEALKSQVVTESKKRKLKESEDKKNKQKAEAKSQPKEDEYKDIMRKVDNIFKYLF